MRLRRHWIMVAAACGLALVTASTQATAATRVYLMRGLADVSTGLDDLAEKLKRRGIPAMVASHTDSDAVAARIIADYKPGDQIVLVGHSLGADAELEVARTIGAKGLKVALLVAFSPASSARVPANVGRAINYYQSNSFWNNTWSPGAGFRGSLRNVDLAKNDSIHHFNIEKLPRLHAAIIGQLRGLGSGTATQQPIVTGSTR